MSTMARLKQKPTFGGDLDPVAFFESFFDNISSKRTERVEDFLDTFRIDLRIDHLKSGSELRPTLLWVKFRVDVD